MKRPVTFLLCAFALIGSASCLIAAPEAPATATPASAAASASALRELTGDENNKKIYYFEHRLIPNFVHTTEGKFFEDLISHNGKVFRQAAAKIVGESFAAQLKVEVIEPDKAALITFAPPTRMSQCYYAIVAKTDSGYAYITLEKTMDLAGSGNVKAMYCGWTADGIHENFGPRDYDTAEAFVKEFLSRSPATPPRPQASSRPAR